MTHPDSAYRALLIISRSGRVLAASAVRAGYVCDVIDEFGDEDTRRLVRHVHVAPGRICRETLEPLLLKWQAGAGRDGTAVILPGSSFEARPELLGWLRGFGTVAANTADTVAAVKDPARFFPLLDSLAVRHPPVHDPARDLHADTAQGDWLVKPAGGEGGVGIRPCKTGEPVPEGHYLQQQAPGRLLSALFLADGSRAHIVGFNNCYSVADFEGIEDYRFAAVIRTGLAQAVADEATSVIGAIVAATGLCGLCGMDMLWDGAGLSVLEINPRPPASLDLHEDEQGSLVTAHLNACNGMLPPQARPPAGSIAGKRVVYAPTPVHIARQHDWPAWTADRPPPGSRLQAGTPLCTVYARAATPAACRQRLQERHDKLLNSFKKTIQSFELKEFNLIKEATV